MGRPTHSFEREWPALARRVDRVLAPRNVAPWLREDIVQETGLRLFRMWESIDPHRSVRALAVTIALNLLRDEARRWHRGAPTNVVPDRAAQDDVERESLARLEFQQVQGALRHLSPGQRAVLLAEVGAASLPDVSPDAVRMLRMRARRRLSELLDRAAAFAGAIMTEGRRLLDRVSFNSSRHAPVSEGFASACVAFSAIALLGISPPGPEVVASDPVQSVDVAAGSASVWSSPAGLEIAPVAQRGEVTVDTQSTQSDEGLTSALRDPPRRARDYGVTVDDDDGPASAEATVTIGDSGDDGDTTDPPSCTADPSSLPTEVTISCRVSTPTNEVEFRVRAKIRPTLS
ncbi:MAG: RNA polymerase sigma factor [Actinomycetota bacterium]